MGTTINQRVAIARKRAGYNQKTAAELLSMKHSTYAQMERRGLISGERLVRMAKLYNVTLEYLMLGVEDSSTENDNSTLIVEQPITPPVPSEPQFLLKPRERNLIRLIRSLKEESREEFYKYVEDNYLPK